MDKFTPVEWGVVIGFIFTGICGAIGAIFSGLAMLKAGQAKATSEDNNKKLIEVKTDNTANVEQLKTISTQTNGTLSKMRTDLQVTNIEIKRMQSVINSLVGLLPPGSLDKAVAETQKTDLMRREEDKKLDEIGEPIPNGKKIPGESITIKGTITGKVTE